MRKTPVVLGVLSIIFGSLTALMSLVGMGMGPFFAKLAQVTRDLPGQTEVRRARLEASQASFAHVTSYLYVTSTVLVIMSIALVVIGVGLYRRRAWARQATVAWAIVALTLACGDFIFNVGWMQPHQLEWQREAYAARGVTPTL